jgi:hypothetical protein
VHRGRGDRGRGAVRLSRDPGAGRRFQAGRPDRGEVRDTVHAIADYEQALAIEPRLADVPFNLADAYRKLGRPCDGIFPLEQLSFYNPERARRCRTAAWPCRFPAGRSTADRRRARAGGGARWRRA